MRVSRLVKTELAPDCFKSRQGFWNPRKSTLQNPIFNTPGHGRAKNGGFNSAILGKVQVFAKRVSEGF